MKKQHNIFKLLAETMLLSVLVLAFAGCKSDTSEDSTSGGGGNPTDPTPPRPTYGLPDQDSFDLAATVLNVEAFNRSGETSILTVRLAGKLNDKTVFDGKRVFFSTEGGAIDPFCIIQLGVCTVTWTGQEPRPLDGRASIVAWTDGFESFEDINGNYYFDNGDTFNAYAFGDPLNHDMPEPFRDDNENEIRDVDPLNPNDSEEFIDTNGNNTHNLADGRYNGPACTDTSGRCSPVQSIFIFKQFTITMSGSFIAFANFELGACTNPPGAPIASISLAGNTPTYICATIADERGNSLPKGTTLSLITGATAKIIGGTAIGDALGAGGNRFIIELTGKNTGTVTITSLRISAKAVPSGTESLSSPLVVNDS